MTADVQKVMFTKFHIPAWFWTEKNRVSNGFYFADTTPPPMPNKPPQHTSIFRFLIKTTWTGPTAKRPGLQMGYNWQHLSFAAHWSSPTQATLVCFDLPLDTEHAIHMSLESQPLDAVYSHPYGIHAFILDHVTTLYDTAIWKLRDTVRHNELHRPTVAQPSANYTSLHDMARHMAHSTEVCGVALGVMDSMLSDLQSLPTTISSSTPANTASSILADMLRQRSLLYGFHLRCQATEARLKNEIALVFHIAAQHESMLAQQIAQAAKEDSRAMKTISVLGLVFLPGTFVSVSKLTLLCGPTDGYRFADRTLLICDSPSSRCPSSISILPTPSPAHSPQMNQPGASPTASGSTGLSPFPSQPSPSRGGFTGNEDWCRRAMQGRAGMRQKLEQRRKSE